MDDKKQVVQLNFYDLLILLVRWRKLFIINFLVVVVIASIIVMVVPVWYKATTVLLPPAGGGGGLPSFLSKDLAGVAANFGLEMPTEDIYQTILSSRTLKERIMDKFDFKKIYKMDTDVKPEDMLRYFDAHYELVTREDLSIEVSFIDQDPERSANITNACVAELDNYYREITGKSARINRLFISKRLNEITDTLNFLQDSLANFQRSYNAISISDQTAAMINAAADLKAQQLANDIQIGILESTYGPNHPNVLQLRSSSKQYEKHYQSLLNGDEGDLFIALAKLPMVARTYADIYRQIRIQNTLLEFVYPQYENARIQEGRESANVQILDYAQTPHKKIKPLRRLIVTMAGAASIVTTLVLIFLLEYWKGLPKKNENDWRKVQEIKRIIGQG